MPSPIGHPSPHTVFISHAHADHLLCDRYVEALRAYGLDIWYDRSNLRDGHQLSAEIEVQLKRRTAFVVMLTSASVDSFWVNLETAAFRALAAKDTNRLMLPIRVAECDIPVLMLGIKWIDAASMSFESAISAIAAALGASRPDDLIAQGKALFRGVRYAEALALFLRAAEISPQSAEAWAHVGRSYAYLNRIAEGLESCERALELDSACASAWCSKGICFTRMRKYQDALEAIEQALRHDPADPSAWIAKGAALASQNRSRLALEAYSTALQHDPAYVAAWAAISGIQCKLGLYNEALASAEQALTIDGASPTALFNKGHALLNVKKYDDSLRTFDQLLQLQPHYARAWALKAAALRGIGRVDEAGDADRRAWELLGG